MSLTAKLMLSPVLVAQAIATRARLPRLPEPPGARHGVSGKGAPLRLLLAGDSSAAGVGVTRQRDALAHRVSAMLARQLPARVSWHLLARSGLTTAQTLALLREQGSGQHHLAADVAVVVTGVNDVIDQIPSHRAVAAREALANWLRNGCGAQHVVFAPLPPVHDFPGLPQPLRWVAGSDARRHNLALQQWVATRRDVSCVDIGLPLHGGMMAADGFHPGEPVYRHCAGAIAKHIVERVWPGLHLHSQQRHHA
jgi:lysophospholipase L1-like esterase